MNKYWGQRQVDALYNSTLGTADKLLVGEYKRCMEATRRDLLETYAEILEAQKDDTLLVSDLYKYNRYYELLNNLTANMKKLGLSENQIMEKCLKDMYLSNSQLISNQLGFNTFVNDEAVKDAINSIWCGDGKHYSSRIWSNKAGLEERIKRGIVDCVARGESSQSLVKTLMQDFEVGYNQANRIARTELTYVQTRSTLDRYNASGIKQVEFLAEIDSKTSDVCREHNGKIYNINEVRIGENAPPLHCNCRSCLTAVV